MLFKQPNAIKIIRSQSTGMDLNFSSQLLVNLDVPTQKECKTFLSRWSNSIKLTVQADF